MAGPALLVGEHLSAALLTPLIIWAGRRWPLERQHLPRAHRAAFLSEHRLGAAAGCRSRPRSTSPGTSSGRSSRRSPFKSEITLLFIFGFHTGVVTYWVVLSIQTAIRNYARFQERAQAALRSDLRASQLETQVAQARLGALKAQLQPHFLFNTLNAIVVLVRQQKGQQAEETLARFSDLLRAVLADMDAQEVTLARELEYLKLYLSIEQLRFSDRLRVDIDVDPDLLDAAVPHMALQPLVENSIRHGVGQRATPGVIVIRAASRCGDALHVSVQDDGPGFGAPGAGGGLRLGLANTRARLNQLYGDGVGAAHRERARAAARWSPWCCRFISWKREHERTDRRRRTAGARRHAHAARRGTGDHLDRRGPQRRRSRGDDPCAAAGPAAARRADARDGRLRRAARRWARSTCRR